MNRTILHVDANSFYASVECLYRPDIREKTVAVCGDPEARHGIILTANRIAKRSGVKTGMAIWQAKQVCPSLAPVPADYRLYVHFSKMMRAIYEEYSDRVESFGLDETERKKMILSRMIEKITVDREYRIAIYFFIIPEDFQQELNGFSDRICVYGSSN